MNQEEYKELEEELEEAKAQLAEHEMKPAAHEDTEGVWLISYADLMTLLMGFFALMLSMSDFSEEKFVQTAEEIAEFAGGEVDKPFQSVGDSIQDLVKKRGLEDKVNVEVKKTNIKINFTGTLLFSSGSFELKSEASDLMNEITEILSSKVKDKKILIEGHTDSQPINRGIIASNWELSSLRANAVARLFEGHGFKGEQILTIGLGDTRPLVPHNDETGAPILENQTKNRRVVIKVMNRHPI